MTDRELIDAAIAAGVVRTIPRGVSGLPEFRPQPPAPERTGRRPAGSADQLRQMVKLRAEGHDYRTIAAMTGRSVSMVYRHTVYVHCPRGQKETAELLAMRRKGMTYRQIAAETGRALSAVHRRINGGAA